MNNRGRLMAGIAALGSIYIADVLAREWGEYQVGDIRSGYTYMTNETRSIQDDDFENPAMLWVEKGEELWSSVEGKEGKSCQTCHSGADQSMMKVGSTYPVYSPKQSKLINVEQRINQCRTEQMGAKAWKWESDPLLSMTSFVRHQSRGEKISPVVDGPAKPFFEKGKKFYEERRGQLDMACANCHRDYAGGMIRANRLSQGQSNGFPTYRLKWQKVGSTHRRFRGCNKQVRAKPYAYGSDEYVNLELYLAWRGRGLPVETPAVRN
jgi:sulfur-oxidizing protein SoxA